MKFVKFMKAGGFLLALALVFVLCDLGFGKSTWIRDSGFFKLNDFELTCRDHPEETWDRVLYGSSELTSAYREDLSKTNYVNCGMDYATVLDLDQMLRRGVLNVGEELVIAANWGLMCDTLDTNPTYPWLRGRFEPNFYFQRDRLGPFLTDTWSYLLRDGEPRTRAYTEQQKELYHGNMTAEELSERVIKLNGLYFAEGLDGFLENIAALPGVFEWCESHDIRVRVLWLPEHPDYPLGEVNDAVREAVKTQCEAAGVPFTDMTDALPADCFFDTGHLDWEHGAAVFTEVFDQWAG